MATRPVLSNTTPTGQLVNNDGTAKFAFLKWMQSVGTTVNGAFDSEGNYQGPIGEQATIDGRQTLASIVQNIDTNGVVESSGIDFARIYQNQNIDYIEDGVGSPIAGGKEAYALLVASAPVLGQTIRFNGVNWGLVAIAVSKVAAASEWLRSYDEFTGLFTSSQPGFADISGVASPGQVPPLSSLTGQITTAQLPPSGVTQTVTLAALTGLGATGSLTITNGIITAVVDPT